MNGPEEKKLKVAKLVKQENVDDYDVEILEDKNKESEEEEQEEEEEENDEDGLEEYFSLQPYEIFDIVMNP